MGGLSSLEKLDNAKTWIMNKLWKAYGPIPREIYCKGDFKGMPFIKFGTKGERDATVKIFREAGCQERGHTVWMKPDLLIEERLWHSFVFGVKIILTEVWGWEKRGIWAELKGGTDGKAGVVWFGEEMAVTAKIEESKIVLSYGGGWEQYFQQKEHPDFINLVTSLEAKAKIYKENIAKKGAGKGFGKPSKSKTY